LYKGTGGILLRTVRYYGDPVLRKVAAPVTAFDDDLKELVADMRETLYAYNGVGLAATQIGVLKRLFIALELGEKDEDEDDSVDLDTLTAEEKRKHWGVVAEHVMVNPEVILVDGTQYGQDGCLSVPGLYVEKMRRHQKVKLRYQDETGRMHEREAEGHFAHVIQHELDHLDGILFFDRLPEDERRAFMEEHRQALAELQREAKALLKAEGQGKRERLPAKR
jgi:peptide deformylase